VAVVFADSLTGPTLGPLWVKKGTWTESFSGSGLASSGLGNGEGMYVTLASLGLSSSDDFVVEVGLTKGSAGSMIGPVICDDTFAGNVLSHYSSPAGLRWCGANTSWGYSGASSVILTETAATTGRYRIRRSGTSYYCSRSLDGGATWSTEVAATWSGTPTRVGIAELLGGTQVSAVNAFSVSTPAPEGPLAASLPALSVSLSGDTFPAGPLSATLPTLTASLAGGEPSSGTLDGTLPALSAQFAGGPEAGPVFGSLASTLPALSASADGTSEEFDGGVGFAPTLPDITVPPAAIPPADRLIPILAVSVPPVELVDGRPTQAWKAQAVEHHGVWGAYRLFVGGEDVTLFRGYPFQMPTRAHEDPFGHAATDVVIPGVTPWDLPNAGTGELAWLTRWAPVVLQVVDPDGVDSTIWRGFVGNWDPRDDGMRLTCAGHGSGRLNIAYKTPRPFMFRKDVGLVCYDLARRPGLRIVPNLGLDTGIVIDERSRSGGTLLECVNEVMSLAQQTDGRKMTIMPTGTHLDTYEMRWRDEETPHATVCYGAHGITADLQSSLLDQPTTLFGIGRELDGGVWANLKAPGLFESPPPPFPGTMSRGDDSADVNVLKTRLQGTGYLNRQDSRDEAGFGEATEDGVKALQRDFRHAQTGVVDLATWNALWDLDVTGLSLSMAHTAPLAQLDAVKRFLTTANGRIIGPNPDYDPERPDVQQLTDFGVYSKRQARKREEARRQRLANTKMWAGTLRLDTDLFMGDYHHGDPDPVLLSRFMPLAGLNIVLRGFDGDILLHVASDTKDPAGATLQVDTMGRPSLEVSALVNRNQEGRRNPAKTFDRQHRGIELGGIGEWWSEIGGEITNHQALTGGRWNVIDPVVAGDMGTLAQVSLELDDAVEFACALFAVPVGDAWVNANLPDPFDTVGRLRNLRVTAAGSGYTSAPTVSFSGGGGSGAHAVAHVFGGKVTGIEWTSRGSGYTSAPSVSLSGGGGSGASADVGIGGIGAQAWQSDEVRDMAKRRRILLEAWGDNEQPCGYGDGVKTEGATLDGTFVDAAGLPYRTFASDDVNNGKRCALYWAIFPKSNTGIGPQRCLYPNPEVGM
jgi:hypothetical protein